MEKSWRNRQEGVENREGKEKLGLKGTNQEDSFTLPLLAGRAGYAILPVDNKTVNIRVELEFATRTQIGEIHLKSFWWDDKAQKLPIVFLLRLRYF